MTNVGPLLYRMFFEQAKKLGIVWTLTDLALRDGLITDNDTDPYDVPVYNDHGDAIAKVLRMEISIFVFRRLNGCWGAIIYGLSNERNRFINEYREKTGYQIDTQQDELIW